MAKVSSPNWHCQYVHPTDIVIPDIDIPDIVQESAILSAD